ncbi:uncharacterized protein LOC103968596 [Musa acuminata AAA Group]|uniref:uncharacterized protein LOC103968596 n=1 Tax=Musa acuminata AAA Group TaxID=214697 RepID=UPI0031D28851
MHSTPPGSDPVFDAVVKMLRDWRQSADACTWSIMSVLLLARPLCPAFHMKEGGEQSATVERDVDAPLAILRIRRRRRRRSPREARRCKQHGDEKNEAPHRSEEEKEPEELEHGDTLCPRAAWRIMSRRCWSAEQKESLAALETDYATASFIIH